MWTIHTGQAKCSTNSIHKECDHDHPPSFLDRPFAGLYGHQRVGTKLAHAPGAHDHRLPARRPHRPGVAGVGAATVRTVGSTSHCGQQTRRRWQPGGRTGSQSHARWLHDFLQHIGHRHWPRLVRQGQLRHPERLCARGPDGQCSYGFGGQPAAACAQRQGISGPGQVAPRCTELQLFRHRHHHAFGQRHDVLTNRRVDPAHSLQRQRPGPGGSGSGSNPVHDRHHQHGLALCA